jgi:uncharacterized damage-inducible protein DinB
MLTLLRDLVAHKGHANRALLDAVRVNPAAVADRETVDLLHHVLLANRFWILTILGRPFTHADEARPSTSIDELVDRYARTQALEEAWLASATEADLGRILESPLIPGGACSVAEAFTQVCLHSHGHRAQCAKLLRRHGGVPPASDFILWLAATRGRG